MNELIVAELLLWVPRRSSNPFFWNYLLHQCSFGCNFLICSWYACASSPRSDLGPNLLPCCSYSIFNLLKLSRSLCLSIRSVKGKSKEIQTWKWLSLTFHWPELGHMTHLIPREVGKRNESVSSGRKGIKFNEPLAHLLVVCWTWPLVVSTGDWMRVLGSLCSALCYPGGHI